MQAIDAPFLCEHPLGVLRVACRLSDAGTPVALVLITATLGGGVRAPGAMMAVGACGETAGYVSGGCIDADVRLQALNALRDGDPRSLRYGQGSPFADLPLPCGGAIDLMVCPNPDLPVIRSAVAALDARLPVSLSIARNGALSLPGTDAPAMADPYFTTRIEPRLRLRLAGRGADCLALARIARASGIDVHLQVPETELSAARRALPGLHVTPLTTPGQPTPAEDDPFTAFALMFHDLHWEMQLLREALAGPAFFIGAVGSARTHARRCAALLDAGVSAPDIARIRGPIGLVPSMRDASMLAVSALAEIVDAFHHARVPA